MKKVLLALSIGLAASAQDFDKVTSYHVAPSHTDGDSFVRFKKANVIHTSDEISTVAGRIEAMVKAGKSLQEVLAAKPTREFDEQWGKLRKPEQFVEIVYFGFTPYKK